MPEPTPRAQLTADLTLTSASEVVLVATGAIAWTGDVSAPERSVFDAVNGLPNVPYAVVWPFLQLGSLGGALAVAAVLAVVRRPRAAITVAAAAVVAWATVKLAKALVGRDRPADLLADVVTRGEAATGNGFPSAHATVAAAVATAAWPWIGRPARVVLVALAGAVAVLRVYVGAHLPLDVVGGAALGVAVGGLARIVARAVAR